MSGNPPPQGETAATLSAPTLLQRRLHIYRMPLHKAFKGNLAQLSSKNHDVGQYGFTCSKLVSLTKLLNMTNLMKQVKSLIRKSGWLMWNDMICGGCHLKCWDTAGTYWGTWGWTGEWHGSDVPVIGLTRRWGGTKTGPDSAILKRRILQLKFIYICVRTSSDI